MMHKAKVLGPVSLAAMAILAAAASAAQATPAHLQCGDGEGTCKIQLETDPSKKTQKLTTAVGAVECKKLTSAYEGPATVAESATLAEVEYGNCTVGGAVPATVGFGGCDYTLEEPLTTVEGGSRGGWTLGPEGCNVTIEVSAPFECTITVPGGQTFASSITYTPVQAEGEPEEITGHIDAEGIEYSYGGPACGEGESAEAKYEGTFTAKAFPTGEGEQIDLTAVDT